MRTDFSGRQDAALYGRRDARRYSAFSADFCSSLSGYLLIDDQGGSGMA